MQRDDVSVGEKLVNPSCNCSAQAAGLFVSPKLRPFVTSLKQQEAFLRHCASESADFNDVFKKCGHRRDTTVARALYYARVR